MPHRVLHEIRDDLVQALGVRLETEVARQGFDLEMHVDGVQLRLPDRVLDHRAHVEEVTVEGQRARLEARQIEQLLYEAAEAFDLGEHGLECLRIRTTYTVDKVLEHGLERG